jgi:vitamin B12 transporter
MKTGIFRARLAAFPLALCAAIPSHAQTQLKEVVVTATRTESRPEAVLGDVTVIDIAALQSGVGRTVSEVLARMAGVQTSSNGGLGKTSSIYIRGTENRHVLLLVDGVRMGSSTSGTANFDSIPLEMIERIEVLKGPASALYGSDAVGGVVQIFTRKGRPGFHPFASVTAGEWDRGELSTGFSGGTASLSYAMGVQTLSEGGFSATNRRVGTSFNADRDGFSQTSANASLSLKLTDAIRVDVKALQSDGVNHYDSGSSAFDARLESSGTVGKIGVEVRVMPQWKSRLEVANSTDRSSSLTSTSTSRFNTAQEQISWQNEVNTPIGLVFAGVDSLRENVDGTQAYTVSQRTTDSVYTGIAGESGAHTWQANTRQDRNTQFGYANTGLVSYGFRVTPDLRVHSSYGTSFKMPSFNTLYWYDPNPAKFNGNPTTQPERGENAEVGASLALGEQLLGLTHYQNRIQGFITTQPAVSNVPFVRIEGWTLSLEGGAGAWDYRTSLDSLDARNQSTGLKLARRPDLQLTATVGYSVAGWKLGSSLLLASDSYDTAANTTTLGGYGIVDVYARKPLGKDWSMEGRVVNLGDKFYQSAMGYNQPGRAAYITLRYQPQ